MEPKHTATYCKTSFDHGELCASLVVTSVAPFSQQQPQARNACVIICHTTAIINFCCHDMINDKWHADFTFDIHEQQTGVLFNISPSSSLQHISLEFPSTSLPRVLFNISPSSSLQHLSLEFSSTYLPRVLFNISPSSSLQHISLEFSSTSLPRVLFNISPSSSLQHLSLEFSSTYLPRVLFNISPSRSYCIISNTDVISFVCFNFKSPYYWPISLPGINSHIL